MKELLEMIEFQKWSHLLLPPAPGVYEAEAAKFYANLCYTEDHTLVVSVNETKFELDEMILREILEVPTDEIKTVSRKASDEFKDLVLLEALLNFQSISLPAIMIEHIINVVYAQEGRHGLPYGFLLTKATMGTKKHMFTMVTLEECECVPRKDGVSTSTISTLIEAQAVATAKIQRLKAENALLQARLFEKTQKPGSHGHLEAANAEIVRSLGKRIKICLNDQSLRTEQLISPTRSYRRREQIAPTRVRTHAAGLQLDFKFSSFAIQLCPETFIFYVAVVNVV
ncbi:hypothetical protein RND71_019731 [Anisodus tanguticus]|uniref:Uncharacterized protein n=1 Tax=Anisodus tanguticus TaxID=243964 RepID=A0AAE1RXW3_9SOLA|nr:hypothetical protein RND71_019731 [Anisodus tanguticus]